MEAARKLAEVARGVATKIQQAVGSADAPRQLALPGIGGGIGAGGGGAGGANWLGVVRMRGLPFSASADDIRAFFKDLTIKPDGIVLCEGRDGRPNGEAFVEFTKEAYADDAVQFHRQVQENNASPRPSPALRLSPFPFPPLPLPLPFALTLLSPPPPPSRL